MTCRYTKYVQQTARSQGGPALAKYPVFPWFDEHYLKIAKPDPLAIAARVLALSEYHHATAQEHGDDNAWFTYGLAVAAEALAVTGHLHELGTLLTGLETLVPAEYRAKWPLHDVALDQVPAHHGEPAIGLVH